MLRVSGGRRLDFDGRYSDMNSKKDLVSIIIVNWNGLKWLNKCLDSLYSQTYKNYEIILVDNASTDDSIAFIKENYPEVIIVCTKKNLGFAGGNNLGIEKAKGEYILLLNNDTWVDNDFLDKMLNSFLNSDYDIMGPISANYYTKVYKKYSIHLDLFGHFAYLFGKNARQDNFYLSGVCLLFKKDLYLKSGGLDNDFFMYVEDWDWFWRLHLLNMMIYQNNDILVYHAGAGSTGSGLKYHSFLWRNQNVPQMLLKNYAWYNLIWVLPVYYLQNLIEIVSFLLILRPKIAFSYIESWCYNIRNFRKTMDKRKWIQDNRKVSDWAIMKKMYFGFGKVKHIKDYLRAEKYGESI
jgi:GT2 family glycosyltransferase